MKRLKQQKPRPRWAKWPESPYFVGPNPWIIGIYLIMAYDGYRKPHKASPDSQHFYRARCLRCGTEGVRRQDSVAAAHANRKRSCAHCRRDVAVCKEKTQKEVNAIRDREFNEWVGINQQWPITQAHMRPDNLFDSERYRAAGCRVDVPYLLIRQAD